MPTKNSLCYPRLNCYFYWLLSHSRGPTGQLTKTINFIILLWCPSAPGPCRKRVSNWQGIMNEKDRIGNDNKIPRNGWEAPVRSRMKIIKILCAKNLLFFNSLRGFAQP